MSVITFVGLRLKKPNYGKIGQQICSFYWRCGVKNVNIRDFIGTRPLGLMSN